MRPSRTSRTSQPEHPDHEQVQQTDRHEPPSFPIPPTAPNPGSEALWRVLKRYRPAAQDRSPRLQPRRPGEPGQAPRRRSAARGRRRTGRSVDSPCASLRPVAPRRERRDHRPAHPGSARGPARRRRCRPRRRGARPHRRDRPTRHGPQPRRQLRRRHPGDRRQTATPTAVTQADTDRTSARHCPAMPTAATSRIRNRRRR
jgi:hypothetical protein